LPSPDGEAWTLQSRNTPSSVEVTSALRFLFLFLFLAASDVLVSSFSDISSPIGCHDIDATGPGHASYHLHSLPLTADQVKSRYDPPPLPPR
jgi:hypothetical protein